MKRFMTIAVAGFLCGFAVLHADVFASRIKITNPDGSKFDGKFNDGTGVKIWYYLNDTATAVTVKVINASTGTTVATINATNQGPFGNPNSVTWDGATAVAGAKYYFTFQTTGPVYSATDYTIFKFIATGALDPPKNIYTRGVDANVYMNTPGFGNIYASNSDGTSNDRLRTGVLRYNSDASYYGTVDGDPMLVPSLGTVNGGTFDWSGLNPWYSTVDAAGQIFVTGNPAAGNGIVYKMKNDSTAPKAFIGGIVNPRGLCVVGTGASRKVYIASDTVVWRADIGDNDTLSTPPVLVAKFGIYVRDLIFDDDGHMIVGLRDTPLGTGPAGYIERYDVSSGLPKTRASADWSYKFDTGLPTGLGLIHGPNKSSAADDTLFVSVRAGSSSDNATIGLWMFNDITGFFTTKHLFYPAQYPQSAGGNISANADMTIDYAGNIVYFENGNEEVFLLSPPHAGSTNSQTTRSYDTISVSGSTLVSPDQAVPKEFSLNQNYPNPFNPSTVISYQLPADAKVSIIVYDILGSVVRELFNGTADAGYNAVVWDASGSSGAKVSSGMYLYRITAQLSDGRSFSDTKRMMLLK